jgi:hypothetical protein
MDQPAALAGIKVVEADRTGWLIVESKGSPVMTGDHQRRLDSFPSPAKPVAVQRVCALHVGIITQPPEQS